MYFKNIWTVWKQIPGFVIYSAAFFRFCYVLYIYIVVYVLRMFGMVLEKLYLQDLQKISGEVEQKICAVGVTNILTEAPAMLQNYEAFWSVN